MKFVVGEKVKDKDLKDRIGIVVKVEENLVVVKWSYNQGVKDDCTSYAVTREAFSTIFPIEDLIKLTKLEQALL